MDTPPVDEFRNPIWLPAFKVFLSKVKISSKEFSDGPRAIQLYRAQNLFLDGVADGVREGTRHFVVLKARQLGISTVMLVLDLFWLFMNPGLQGAMIADTADNRENFRKQINDIMESLPPGWKIPVVAHNRNELRLANGSVLQYLSAGKGKNSGLGRSRALSFVHATEISSWGDQKGIDSLMAALAAENPNRFYIFESTALGYNVFYDMWNEAKRSHPTQKAIFIGWWAKDTYRLKEGTPAFERWWGEHPKLTEEEEEIARIVLLQYGATISPEQWAWYRDKADKRSEESMMEEFPSCVSGDTRVGTSEGIIRIDQIKPGMLGTLGEITAAGPTGMAPMFKLKTKLGYELRGTADHPMALSGGGFCDLASASGTTIRLQPPAFTTTRHALRWVEGPVQCAVEITPDLGRFLGIFMGDGSMTGAPHYQMSICCDAQDIETVEEVNRLIRSLWGVEPHSRLVGHKKGGLEIRVGSRLMFETLRRIQAIHQPSGDGKRWRRHVHVPEVIWRSPKEVVREFLRGLFETDGFADRSGNSVLFFTRYDAFARDVQLLLLGFGITSRWATGMKTATRKGEARQYRENKVTLRQAETILFAERVGFISGRKQGRASLKAVSDNFNAKKIVFEDEVASVEPSGVDQSWNVSVGTEKLFDAYGLLTHNTEQEAFVASGHSFFNLHRINTDIQFIHQSRPTFNGWNYVLSDNFLRMKLEPAYDVDALDLRVWEKPKPGGVYVIGVDPAYGRSEEADRSVISVWRCFSDKLVQVAEYATPQPETRQVAWVMAHLASEYRDCIINLEITGPGGQVMQELTTLKQHLSWGSLRETARQMRVEDCLDGAKWFLWNRPDSMSAGYSYNWKTNFDNKLMIFNKYRDMYSAEQVIPRSRHLLDEMLTLQQDGDRIAASGRNKDDRVFAACLAVYAWDTWRRVPMMAENRTYEREMLNQQRIESSGKDHVLGNIVPEFFAQAAQARLAAYYEQFED